MNQPEPHPNVSRLNEYLDGVVPPDEIAVLESHLEQCAPCAQRLAVLRRVFTSLADLPDPALAPDLSAGVTQALKRERQGLSAQTNRPGALPRLRLPQLVTALQALAALLLLVAYWRLLPSDLAYAPPDIASVWHWVTGPIFALFQPLLARLAMLSGSLPQWNTAAFPLFETLILLAFFWLAGNGYLIFGTRHSRRKQ
jgi:anti-sigma factor RsiW